MHTDWFGKTKAEVVGHTLQELLGPSATEGGAINRLSLLLLIIVISANAAYARRRQRAMLVTGRSD